MPDMDRQLVVRDMPFPDCPIRNVLARIADKWSLLVLYTLLLHDRPVRFKELQRSVPDISQKMLTTTLRTLEQDGYVRREVFAEVPPRSNTRQQSLRLRSYLTSMPCLTGRSTTWLLS